MTEYSIISIQEFCKQYDVPESFIEKLYEYELISFAEENSTRHIPSEQINNIEKLIRLHFDLNINFEGLDVILNLLNKIDALQEENRQLKNQLMLYI